MTSITRHTVDHQSGGRRGDNLYRQALSSPGSLNQQDVTSERDLDDFEYGR